MPSIGGRHARIVSATGWSISAGSYKTGRGVLA
jgi:hypothetical protein